MQSIEALDGAIQAEGKENGVDALAKDGDLTKIYAEIAKLQTALTDLTVMVSELSKKQANKIEQDETEETGNES